MAECKRLWLVLAISVYLIGSLEQLYAQDSWPQLLGGNQGHATSSSKLVSTWSEKKNVVWKTAIAGSGWSSPVVDGSEIWLTTAIDKKKSLRAICVDKDSGEIRLDVEVFKPRKLVAKHARNTHATPTPVLDDKHVYVHFGAYGTAALDRKSGEKVWENKETVINHQWGPGSSPALHDNLLLLNCDGMDLRYVVALDKSTGEKVWKTDRSIKITKGEFFCKAFSTPTIAEVDGKPMLLTAGANQFSAISIADGKESWSNKYFGYAGVTVPIVANGMAFITSGYGDLSLMAVQLNDTEKHKAGETVWSIKRNAPIIPTPIVLESELYMVSDDGIMSCLDAATGKVHWRERLQGKFAASITYGDKKLFLSNDRGETFVVSPSKKKCEILGKNRLDGNIQATPALVGNSIFLRTKKSLYRISKSKN